MTTCDVAIIGGGAAGLSAALVLARARRRVFVIDSGHPRNAPAAHMHGYLSRDGMPPADLLAAGRREVAGYGGRFLERTVTTVGHDPAGPFDLRLDDGTSLQARRLLIATGLADRIPDLPGLAARWGRDVLHCPYCHGYEVRDQPLGVLGGTPGAVQHALLIRQWSSDVVYFAHTSEPGGDDRERLSACGIAVVDGPVERLVVEADRLVAVAMADGRQVRRTAVFVRPELVGNNALLHSLGARCDDAGWPIVDATGASSVYGLWVAGNAVNPRAQVITAAGEGSAAAIAINNDLVEESTRDALRDLAARRTA